jgi:glucokinase
MVAQRATEGDTAAKKIFDEAGRYLGRGISILANTLNFQKIIIGGGIASAGTLLLDPVMREFEKNTMKGIREKTRMCLSTLGMDAAVRGAIAMALDDMIYDHRLVNHL